MNTTTTASPARTYQAMLHDLMTLHDAAYAARRAFNATPEAQAMPRHERVAAAQALPEWAAFLAWVKVPENREFTHVRDFCVSVMGAEMHLLSQDDLYALWHSQSASKSAREYAYGIWLGREEAMLMCGDTW
jgi:hypothetical protein